MKKYKYIKDFPKPFLKDLVQNRCIPIIGAGFSKNAIIPANRKMLDWDELGKAFAEDILDYKYTSAIDAISAYTYEYSRTSLVEKLKELLLIDSVKPGKTHKAFCELQFDIVCTTNLEFLLEQGYNLIAKHYTPIVDESQLPISGVGDDIKILKLHGDVNHPNRLVATEEDYDKFLSENPMLATYLSNLLITRTPLFIGYSLDDADFRQIWQVIKNRLGNLRRQAYVLKVNCSEYEKARFERRGVKVINLPGEVNEYSKILEEVFVELRQYWNENVLVPIISENSTQAELSLPDDVQNRLCFFSTPIKNLSFYKEYIFPIASKYGLVPIAADDVISVGDNWFAKVSALINKAEFVVLDIDSKYTMTELGVVVNQNKPSNKILIITSDNMIMPLDYNSYRIIQRPHNLYDHLDEYIQIIESWFRDIAIPMENIYDEEPRRLIKKREYKAAIISAVTLLEVHLKRHLENRTKVQSANGLYSIYNLAFQLELINREQYAQIKQWAMVRNRLVHTTSEISASDAKQIVNDIFSLLDILK